MRVEVDAELSGALNHVLPVHALRERLVFHLPAHAGNFHLGDRPGWFDQGSRREEAGKFVAGEERLVEVRDARHAGVFRMAEDRGAQRLGPALAFQFADAHKRVLLSRGMALVIKIVQQGRGRVKLEKSVAVTAGHSEPVCLGLAIGGYTRFHRQGVFAEALAGRPLRQELPCLFPSKALITIHTRCHRKIFIMLMHLVRVSLGFSGYYGEDLGLTLSFYLTIMVHPRQISTRIGAEKHPGRPALATREQPMATALVSVETREVVRCEHCTLVQYRTSNSLCRKCHKPLDIEEPIILGPQPVPAPSAHSSGDAGLHVAGQVREIRKARHLSQRQLASRMQVPRTYISKIENGKAIPTLGSLERLACALEVEVSRLVRDARSVREEEIAAILADPFLAEIATLLPRLDSLQRTLFYGSLRDKANGQRRTA